MTNWFTLAGVGMGTEWFTATSAVVIGTGDFQTVSRNTSGYSVSYKNLVFSDRVSCFTSKRLFLFYFQFVGSCHLLGICFLHFPENRRDAVTCPVMSQYFPVPIRGGFFLCHPTSLLAVAPTVSMEKEVAKYRRFGAGGGQIFAWIKLSHIQLWRECRNTADAFFCYVVQVVYCSMSSDCQVTIEICLHRVEVPLWGVRDFFFVQSSASGRQ